MHFSPLLISMVSNNVLLYHSSFFSHLSFMDFTLPECHCTLYPLPPHPSMQEDTYRSKGKQSAPLDCKEVGHAMVLFLIILPPLAWTTMDSPLRRFASV